MTMLEKYGVNYPCIIDMDIANKLTIEQMSFVNKYDYFVHYDNDNNIILAALGDGVIGVYRTITELQHDIDICISFEQ